MVVENREARHATRLPMSCHKPQHRTNWRPMTGRCRARKGEQIMIGIITIKLTTLLLLCSGLYLAGMVTTFVLIVSAVRD